MKGKKNMTAKLPEEYKDNQIEYTSPAYVRYMLETDEQMKAEFKERMESYPELPQDREIRETLESLSTADDFFRRMRRELREQGKAVLQKELLKKEELVADMIKKRALTNLIDVFVDQATHFFINCKEDPCEWIMENYEKIRNPYTQSMMCLVLGFRGNESHIDFLLRQEQDLLRRFPEESFDQGPVVAVYMLCDAEKYLK